MSFVSKTEITDPNVKTFEILNQKTMYGGKHVEIGDIVFVFASENDGGQGLIARGVVTHAERVPRRPGVLRETPRVNITVRRTGLARLQLGRRELKRFNAWNDGQPATELNFKLYRQATNKIVEISNEAATFLGRFF